MSLSSCDFLAPKTLHCFVSAEAVCGCDTGAVIGSSGPPTYSNSLNSGASSTLGGYGSAPSTRSRVALLRTQLLVVIEN